MDGIGLLKARVMSSYLAVSALDGRGPHRLRPRVETGLQTLQCYSAALPGQWLAGVFEPTVGGAGFNHGYAPGYVTVGRTEEEALRNLLDWLGRRSAELGAGCSAC